MVGGRVSYFYYYLASLLLFRLKTPAPRVEIAMELEHDVVR